MAADGYVSVSWQSDTENADLDRECGELATAPEHEHSELTGIYVARRLDVSPAGGAATQLMAKDALDAHARATNSAYPTPGGLDFQPGDEIMTTTNKSRSYSVVIVTFCIAYEALHYFTNCLMILQHMRLNYLAFFYLRTQKSDSFLNHL